MTSLDRLLKLVAGFVNLRTIFEAEEGSVIVELVYGKGLKDLGGPCIWNEEYFPGTRVWPCGTLDFEIIVEARSIRGISSVFIVILLLDDGAT